MESEHEVQNWYKALVSRLRPFQFNWIGRTKDGVNRWIGAPKGPSERGCKFLIGYGITASVVASIAMGALMMRLGPHGAPLGLLALIAGIHGALFSILGVLLLKMRRNVAHLKTVEELGIEFGATPETVKRMAEAHAIRARININNNDLYDPEEFLASRSLLRGTSAPNTSETLLRAVDPVAPKDRSETLLRPVEADTEGLAPVQQLFYATEKETEEREEVIQSLRHRSF